MMYLMTILLLAAFLLGFGCGKCHGDKSGYSKGLADAPLILRQESLEQGCCTLCGKVKKVSVYKP